MEAIDEILGRIAELGTHSAGRVYAAIVEGSTDDVSGVDIATVLYDLEGEAVFEVINPRGDRAHVFSDDGELRCIAEDRTFIGELNIDTDQLDGVQARLDTEFIPFDGSFADTHQ